MKPDKIYLQACGSCDLKETCENCEFAKLLEGGEVTWSEDKIFERDVEYIRKDYLLEWAKERYQQTISNVGCYTGHSVWAEVIEKLESL